MEITLLQPFNLDTTGNYTFATVIANIKTDNLMYANGSPYVFSGEPGGTNTQIQFNDGGSFSGNSNFTFDKTNSVLTISGNLFSSNANLGNAATANFFIGSGNNLSNIQGANVTGSVAFATTANSVAGANVIGQTANALVAGTVYTNAQPNITSVGTLTGLSVSGNLVSSNANLGNAATANFFIGDGSLLTGLPAGYSNADVANYLPTYTGDISVNDITIANSVTALSFIGAGEGGNISGADYVTANFFVGDGSQLTGLPASYSNADVANYLPTYIGELTAGNANLGNLVIANYFSGSGNNLSNIQGANVTGEVANALVSGTVYTNAQPNITSVGTLTSLSVSGNLISDNANLGNAATANFFIGDGSLLTGLPAGYSNADVANYLPTYTGNLTAGNANLGNAATANFFIGDGSLLTLLTGANVTGQVANALVSGTVYTSEQPNITSTGTLTSLSVTGNVGFIGANVALGNISNLRIGGGNTNYVISTDGAGNLAWVEQIGSGISILPDIIVNSFTADGAANAFTLTTTPASKSFTTVHIDGVYQTENAFSLTGNVISFIDAPFTNSIVEITTFVQGATSTTGTVTNAAQPNITSLGTLSSLSVTGNMTTGHIIPSANITYDLGSNTNRFRDLYLSSNTIYLGDTVVSAADILPIDLTIAPEVLEIQASAPDAGNDITWLFTWEQSTLPFARTKITNSPQNSVPLYRQGTYQFNNFANEQTGNMTQRHGLFFKWVDGSGLDNLVSWAVAAGNVSMSHPDINGNVATTVQRINVTVPSTIEIPQLVAPNVTYDVSFANTGAYTISNGGAGENRNIGPLYRGGTYTFNLDSSLANHPFYITTDNGTNFQSNTYFSEYTTGVTGSRNNGTTGKTTLTFVVANSAPSTLYYQCGVHSSMRGAITIRDLAVETNVNGNPIIYLQHGKEGHKTPVEIRPLPSLVNQMCIVYDGATGKFVPQDLATYVENTPSFKNKIQEVAGTATLVAPDGIAVVPTVSIAEDSSYLPLVGNKDGDITYTEDSDSIYIWNNNAWKNTKATITKNITMAQSGNITAPFTGISRAYPTSNILISNIYASLGTPSTSTFTFQILKNGTNAGQFSIGANSHRMTAQSTSIVLTTSDYLTVNILEGTSASDLKIDLEYVV